MTHLYKLIPASLIVSIAFFLLPACLPLCAQEMPPKPVSLAFKQNMSFGAFAPGMSGGTVTITSTGIRFAMGSVLLVDMGYLYFPAIFELEGNPGTIVHLLNGPDATLVGSNGGFLTLQLGDATPGDPIIVNVAPPGKVEIRLGGTLTVGNPLANPPGFYNGFFSIMVIQE